MNDSISFKHYQNLVGGKWIDSSNDERIDLLDPATEIKIGSIPVGAVKDVDRAVEAAQIAFLESGWAQMGWRERSRILRKVGETMMRRKDEIALAETIDQGRPLRQSQGMMVPLAAGAWEFFAGALMTFTGEAAHPEPWASGYTLKQPIGVVGCITPGNVPLVLGSEKLAPALAAGNCVILKPPPECPISSVLLVDCMVEAGVPEGVINLVLGDGATVGRAMAEHPGIGMIAFTGSTNTGKQIMVQAASNVKRLLLELGGKAPQVVFEDADVDGAVEGAMWGAYLNGGQICMAVTRILVHESIFDSFAEKLVEKTKLLRIGPGVEMTTDLGPMVSARIRDRVKSYIQEGKKDGAKVLLEVDGLNGSKYAKGYWVQPTIFSEVTPGMSIVHDEIFGPVPVLQKFNNLEQAVQMANDTPFGLTGSVWTNNLQTALTMAEKVRAGYVWINDHLIRATGFPFGGWQQSGFGREAASQTLDEFSNTKSVYFDRTGLVRKPRYNLLYPG